MAIALDSSVVIGFLDASDQLHEAADALLRELLTSDRLVVSVVTYAEVLAGARLGHHEETHVQGFFEEVISRVIPVDVEVADRAASIRSKAGSLAMPDALIVATAELDEEIATLVTSDHGISKLRGVRGRKIRLLGATG